MSNTRIYLDHNASAPLRGDALRVMIDALQAVGNASSVHGEGRSARRMVERARQQVAALAGARAEHVTFTSGATEAATMLLTSEWVMGRAPLHFSQLYVCAADHPCLLSGGRFARDQVHELPVDNQGRLDLEALKERLAGHDKAKGLPLVAVHLANNETGVLQPVSEISRLAREHGATLILDAVQAAGRIPLVDTIGNADFLILSSHKIGGPQGAGAIIGASDLMMPRPLVRGGGQEKGHRAGTENVAAIAGFGAAAEAAAADIGLMGEVEHMRDRLEAAVLRHFPAARIHGRGSNRLPNTSFFTLPDVKAETAQIAFDLEGFAVSAGSACSSGKVGPSHVLRAMGADAEAGAIRVSLGAATKDEEIGKFITVLERFARRRNAKETAA
ncbi:cysteine desulfurase family protein [Nitratireductor basaltis]|uniref:Cysteine desulfurase n=1 Tax=Nitratireductor basaltis TaxID=472175 RepID=A0A084UAB8_9HYPH|nr:cysteine desulfurase family protein [Nitratireductor basaltis]KFB09904.1 Nitrogenase cofactor synthesis protein nifS [Nitratireductor basaltis]